MATSTRAAAEFVFTPVTCQRRMFETVADYPLDIMDLIDEVVAAKIDAHGQPSLLKHDQDYRYSAFKNHAGSFIFLPDSMAGIEPFE